MRRSARATKGNRYEQVILEEKTKNELAQTLTDELQEELGVFAVIDDPTNDGEFELEEKNNSSDSSSEHTSEYTTVFETNFHQSSHFLK